MFIPRRFVSSTEVVATVGTRELRMGRVPRIWRMSRVMASIVRGRRRRHPGLASERTRSCKGQYLLVTAAEPQVELCYDLRVNRSRYDTTLLIRLATSASIRRIRLVVCVKSVTLHYGFPER